MRGRSTIPTVLTNASHKKQPLRGMNMKNLSTSTLLQSATSGLSQLNNKNEVSSLSLFGINLSVFSDKIIFLILILVVLFGFILIGLVEEGFKFAFPEFKFGWSMTAIELIIFSIFALFERMSKEGAKMFYNIINKDNNNTNNNNNNNNNTNDENELLLNICEKVEICSEEVECKDEIIDDNISCINILLKSFSRNVELRYHLLIAFSMTCSRGFTNIAMLLLNYPTQVIFKSMKLISVMIGSIYFLKKNYTTFEYFAAPFMVCSAILFTLGDSNDTLTFNVFGIISVLVSLIFDSIHANGQELVLTRHKDSTLELLVYSNFFSGIFALIISFITGEIFLLIVFFNNHSIFDVLMWFIIRVSCLYIGVSAFIVFTKKFGAVAAVTVTTVRKIMTVLLSYIFWPGTKVFSNEHGWGSLLFFLSLALNAAGVRTKVNSINN